MRRCVDIVDIVSRQVSWCGPTVVTTVLCSPVQCYLMSPLWTSRRRLRHYSALSGKTSTIIGCYCELKLKRQSRYHRNLIFLSVWRCNCETWIRNNSIPIFVDILIELDNLNLRTTVDKHWFSLCFHFCCMSLSTYIIMFSLCTEP